MVAGNETSSLAKIRDELNIQRGAYNETVKNNKIAADEIKKLLQNISPEQLKVLNEFGVDTDELLKIDVDRLTTDKEYLAKLQNTVSDVSERITKDLEEILGINSNL